MKWIALAALSLAALSPLACADHSGFDLGGGDAGPDPDGGIYDPDANPFQDKDGQAGFCGDDLHSIVDANGKVLSTCGAGTACKNGFCVPSCQAFGDLGGSIGCDFQASTPSGYVQNTQGCFVVFLTNAWTDPAKLTIERDGQKFDPTIFGRIPENGKPASMWAPVPSTGLLPGQVAALFLSHDPKAVQVNSNTPLCPITPAVQDSTEVAYTQLPFHEPRTGRGKAFHITSNVPVNGYSMHPFGLGGANTLVSGASLLLPTTAWGTNYVTVNPPQGVFPMPWFHIVATQDNTTVTILPSVDLPAAPSPYSDLPAAPMNKQTTFTMNAGEVVQWITWDAAHPNAAADPTGSIIKSDKPVGVLGGNSDMANVVSDAAGEFTDEQEVSAPVSALGSEYVSAPEVTRRADMMPMTHSYRVVGAVNGTTLTFDPPVKGAPTTVGVGQVINFETAGAFVISSQDDAHPFSFGETTGGYAEPGGERLDTANPASAFKDACGAPQFIGLIPSVQWLNRYLFVTDPTYATSEIVVVRAAGKNGFADVTLDCAGTLGNWKPVDAAGKYQITSVDLQRGLNPNGKCQNGPHAIASTGSFATLVFGVDAISEYAYAAGGRFHVVNKVVVQPDPH